MKKLRARSKMQELMISVLRIGVAAYLGLCLLVFLIQSSYVYYPESLLVGTPLAVGLDFEGIEVETPDGETIHGWYVPSAGTGEGSLKYILFCHGNAGNMGDRLYSIKTFHEMGLGVFIFDYRGYGPSSGKPSEQGTYTDALAFWEHITEKRGIEPCDITLFGRSLGGAVATWLAVRVNPAALAVESSFTSATDMASRMFPFLPIRLLCRFKYDSLSRMNDIECPVIIAHSKDDEMIPFSYGRRLYEAANAPKTFVTMSGKHNDCGIDSDASYQSVFSEFIGFNE